MLLFPRMFPIFHWGLSLEWNATLSRGDCVSPWGFESDAQAQRGTLYRVEFRVCV